LCSLPLALPLVAPPQAMVGLLLLAFLALADAQHLRQASRAGSDAPGVPGASTQISSCPLSPHITNLKKKLWSAQDDVLAGVLLTLEANEKSFCHLLKGSGHADADHEEVQVDDTTSINFEEMIDLMLEVKASSLVAVQSTEAELRLSATRLASCAVVRDAANVSALENAAGTANTSHNDCRGEEQEMALEQEADYHELNRTWSSLAQPSCMATMSAADPWEMRVACFQEVQVWLAASASAIQKNLTSWEISLATQHNQTDLCKGWQDVLVTAVFTWIETADATCAAYQACFAESMAAHTQLSAEANATERLSKADYTAADEVLCRLRVFNITSPSEKEEAIALCDAAVNTSQLDVAYPHLVEEDLCIVPEVANLNLPDKVRASLTTTTVTSTMSVTSTATSTMTKTEALDGFTTVLKIGKTSTFGYSSAYWENDELLNPESELEVEEDAKYPAYLTEPVAAIRMCIGAPASNCVTHEFVRPYASAKDLFSSGYTRDPYIDRDGILQSFGPEEGTYQDCPMQRPGFNIKCNDGNWARWGFCLNCPVQSCQNDDNNDADAAIGIGLAGQATSPQMGAGWTAYFSGPGTCGSGPKEYKAVWVAVARSEEQ